MENKPMIIETPKEITAGGIAALNELRAIVATRPDKLVIQGKQYLYFPDWQLLGRFFGITAQVTEVTRLTESVPVPIDPKFTVEKFIGFHARADALKDGKVISSAEAICMTDEPNWKGKQQSFLYSMAQTRACAKVLRNVLQWIVRLPTEKEVMQFADESAEEIEQ